jgi:hypothetical protein
MLDITSLHLHSKYPTKLKYGLDWPQTYRIGSTQRTLKANTNVSVNGRGILMDMCFVSEVVFSHLV